jgi:hypothetical protein
MDEMNRLFPPARYHSIHICRSIEDILELNESSTNHLDDTNVLILPYLRVFSITTTAMIAY